MKDRILLLGDTRLTLTVRDCLVHAGHQVRLVTSDKADAAREAGYSPDRLGMGIVVTEEDKSMKRRLLRLASEILPANAMIAVNTESIPLSDLQAGEGGRVVGMNWTEPADTSFFLEMIVNDRVNYDEALALLELANAGWGKRGYIIRGELGIRGRILAAMAREAFYLVEHGYASVEDIDRACRNDPGYYLPFCGHMRYMDLMGTPIYGIVMKDLNPELATGREVPRVPEFFTSGLYRYAEGEREERDAMLRKFSHEIRAVMEKYI